MKNRVRRILGFVLAVVLIQGLALLLFTPRGLELLFPLPLRLAAERVRPDQNVYAVYYDAREDITDADLIVVALDPNVAESYDVLGHFTRFVKQHNNISDVLMPFTERQVLITRNLMKQTEEERFMTRLTALYEIEGLSADCCGYLEEIFYINSTMGIMKKVAVTAYDSPEEGGADYSLAGAVANAALSAERTSLCVVEVTGDMRYDHFRDELTEALPGKTILFTEICYDKTSASPETHESLAFPLPTGGAAGYFVKNRDLEWFYRYYRFVNGLFGTASVAENPLDTRRTDYFFVVTGGTETLR